jgi:hypothetical protein
MIKRAYYLEFSLVSEINPKTVASLLKELKIQNLKVKISSQKSKLINITKEELKKSEQLKMIIWGLMKL